MRTYRLAVRGFGNVGQGLAQLVRDDADRLAAQFGIVLTIVAVSDPVRGSLYDPSGLDPGALLKAVAETGSISALPALQRGWDAHRTIADAESDVVVEVSHTDLRTGEPATGHIRQALMHLRHVVTTNKGPIALHFAELEQLAGELGVSLGVEGTVMSGTPVLRLGRELLAVAQIDHVEGILNGTTNFILTEMERGADYAEALANAQARGYAEADPTGDVDGHDAAAKLVILANLLFGVPLRMGDIQCRGIRDLSNEAISGARATGQRWKLVARLHLEEAALRASVQPERIPLDHPLAGVMGATNAIRYGTRLLGDVTLVGPGAGRLETACAIVEDIAAIPRNEVDNRSRREALTVMC